jgi:hypothetical protein
MPKRCFVISPIGDTGSPVREHADDVFEFIIKPAMEELGITPYRADHSHQLGKISDHMFSSILNEDLCIAILTFHNPNVFYELAIAQSAARPVIIMIERGQTIPFDIRDIRAIEYDLKPRPLRDKVYANQIIEHVRSLEALDWQVPVPFGPQLTPLGFRQGDHQLFENVESFGTSERFHDLIKRPSKVLDMSGMTLRWWRSFADFKSTIRTQAANGCKVRFMLMDPSNPTLELYINKSNLRGGVHDYRAEIASAETFFHEIAQGDPNIEVRTARQGFTHHHIVRTSDFLYLPFLMNEGITAQAPLLWCKSSCSIYKRLSNDFDSLWAQNPPLA